MEVIIIENKFILKSKVHFGNNALEMLKELTGKRAFIVVDAIMEKLGYLQKTVDLLSEAGISSVVYSDVRPDPDVKIVANGLKHYKESTADILIALGGGSAIDTAKGILYFAWKFDTMEESNFKKPLFVAIPSTSGTGSEVTDFSVVTTEDGKVCIVDEFMAPDIAILDSTCIQHVPKHVVADTGIDVLVHAMEAYVSTKATDFTDALAEKAVKLIFENLGTIYTDINNTNARDHVLNASCMAGMAFTNTGLGINHSLAHAFSGTFHISHGRSNALMIGAVLEFNADLSGDTNSHAAEKYAKLATILNLPARTRREGIVSLMDAIRQLKKNLGIEDNIKSLGIAEDDFENALDKMAEAAMADRCTPTNPKQPSKENMIQIFRKSFGQA